jgi:hypothetical protein
MRASDGGVDRQTVHRLLSARLLVRTKTALTRDEVVKAVAQALCPPLSKQAAESVTRDELERCEQAGWVVHVAAPRARSAKKRPAKPKNARKARAVAPRLALSAEGRAEAAAMCGGALPVIRNWEHAQQWVALSQIGRSAAATKTLHVDALAAAVLGARSGVSEPADELAAVVDCLAWRELGVETSEPFEIDAVQRYLLRRIVPHDVRVNQKTWRRMLAMKSIGASSPDAKGLVRALLARAPDAAGTAAKPARKRAGAPAPKPFQTRKTDARATLAGFPSKKLPGVGTAKPPDPVANDNSPRPRAQPTLADFAAAVRDAARLPSVARFHEDRAFIGSVWEQMRSRGLLGPMSLDEFKVRLIAAYRDGLLRITRAELIAAMDPVEVERSEARYQDATFHFVALDTGGVR